MDVYDKIDAMTEIPSNEWEQAILSSPI